MYLSLSIHIYIYIYIYTNANLTNAEYERLDAFQIKALRNMLWIQHSYHSHVSNEVVMQTANQRIRLKEGRTIVKMSEKLINRQVKFMAHLLRAEERDITKACTMNRDGFRISAGFKRTGRPRIKCYDQVMNACCNRLVTMGLLLPSWKEDIRVDEAKQIVFQTEQRTLKERLQSRKRPKRLRPC